MIPSPEGDQAMFMMPQDIRQENRKVIQDPVHGSIELHDLLVKIIDTKEFQRLRRINQTGLTYLVYPGASHNRFEHCIGVSHLAAMMLDALEKNSPEEMKNVTTEEKLCVLIAGLLHDLGHGPFSHTWEVFAAMAEKHFEHEDLSKKLFLHMLDERGGELRKTFGNYKLGDREILLIQELIDGGGTALPNEKQFLYEIIANKKTDIDVDKWDYFLRDGQALGIKVTFDYQRLLKFTKVVELDGEYTIAYRDKEKFSLEEMFRMRAELHVRAYQHPVVKKLEAMWIDVLLAADPHFEVNVEGEVSSFSEAHNNLRIFVGLSDHQLSNIENSTNPKLDLAKTILARIYSRQLYHDVDSISIKYEMDISGRSPKAIPGNILAKIRNNIYDKFKEHIILTHLFISSGKFCDPISQVKFYMKCSSKPRSAPKIKYDLPHSAVKIYSREVISDESKETICRYILEELRNLGLNCELSREE